IRTGDLCVPNAARWPAAPRPVHREVYRRGSDSATRGRPTRPDPQPRSSFAAESNVNYPSCDGGGASPPSTGSPGEGGASSPGEGGVAQPGGVPSGVGVGVGFSQASIAPTILS